MIMHFVALLVSVLTYLYYRLWKKLKLWSSMGLAEDPGSFVMGSQPNSDALSQKSSFNDMFDEAYEKFRDQKMWGSYGMFGEPHLIINDLDLAKDVLIKDFDVFPQQRDLYFGTDKYLNDMLLILTGDRWKAMRTLATPIFTSGKLKGMTPIIESVGDRMVEHLEGFASKSQEFECKELFSRYSIDIVATTGFGIDGQCFTNPDGVFKDQVDKLLSRGKYKDTGGFLQQISVSLGFLWADMARLLKLEPFSPEAAKFFTNIIKAQIKERQKTGKKRNDFIQSLLQGFGQSEKEGNDGSKIFKSQEDLEQAIVANGLVLLLAGFDTSSTTGSAIVWFLVKNPDVQEALYNEVRDAIEENGGSPYLDYDTIQNLQYLEGVVMESTRLHPIGHLERLCRKEYTFKGTNTTIKPGTLVMIPTVNMMKDSKYFEDPLKFDPTRWSKEGESTKNPFLHFTFGQGPRNCIGKRFAMLQLKMAVARLVTAFKFEESERTTKVLKSDPNSLSMEVIGGVWVKCVRRD